MIVVGRTIDTAKKNMQQCSRHCKLITEDRERMQARSECTRQERSGPMVWERMMIERYLNILTR